MTRSVNDFVTKRASSMLARSPVSESSKTRYRWIRPCADEVSLRDSFSIQAARALSAARKTKTSDALSFRTVFVEQSLKLWIVSQRIPHRTESETRHGDVARPA